MIHQVNCIKINILQTYILSTLLGLFAMACGSAPDTTESPLLVAAASDLAKAGPPLVEAFERSGGPKVTFSFGSSGQLAQQIRQGAPFDIYASAARSFCQSLAQDGHIQGECRLLAIGRLVAWSSSLELRSLSELQPGAIRQVAIANPLTAPYGKAAQEALQAAGLWDGIQSKLVYAESVAHALQMAETGNADVALVALALVIDAGRPFYLVEANLHQPIEQPAAVLRDSHDSPAAAAFLEFLFSIEGRRILSEYGYEPPAAAPAR